MRIALLADIHANREAFEAVLARVTQIGVDRIALLGDIVGYGPDPVFCVERASRLIEDGALSVIGNHDAAITGDDEHMNAIARAAIAWTREQLGLAHCAMLDSLEVERREDDVLFVHANARAPLAWDYVTNPVSAERSLRATDARITIVGHVHSPHLWRLTSAGVATGHAPVAGMEMPLARSQTWLAVMGAVGQPRDGNPAAAFGILDTRRRSLTYERVGYDHFTTCRKLREARLPEALAARLLKGR